MGGGKAWVTPPPVGTERTFTCSKEWRFAFFANDVISLRMCCFTSCYKRVKNVSEFVERTKHVETDAQPYNVCNVILSCLRLCSIATVVRRIFQLARCGYQARVTPQTSFSIESITPRYMTNKTNFTSLLHSSSISPGNDLIT